MIKGYIEKIDRIISKDSGCRGLSEHIKTGDIYEAINTLYKSERIVVVTGFCIKEAMIGETDGPLGAVSLCNGLKKLGKKTLIATDIYSSSLIARACAVMDIDMEILIIPLEDSKKYIERSFKRFNPDAVVAIERPGVSGDGNLYSMSEENLSDVIPKADSFFEIAKQNKIKTIAIGDGGNEMGMGNIKEEVKKYVKHGEKICSVSTCDNLIVAGVSNWGGHGIVAGLSLLKGENLLHTKEIEQEMLESIVDEGAVDGCSKEPQCTVDGLDLDINLNVLEDLRKVVEEALQ